MTATLVERLGALGDLSLSLTWDPLIYQLLHKDALVRIWKGEKVYAASIVTRRGGDSRTGIQIGGRDPRTLLGHDNFGPVLERQEFVAGTTRLSNGGFTLLDPAIPTHALFWTFAENTAWAATGTGLVALDTSQLPTKDDVLLTNEQPPAAAGQAWEAKALAAWLSPSTHPEGKFRLRLIFFGHFDNPELLVNDDFELGPGVGWGTADYLAIEAGGALTGTYALRAGPIPLPQLIAFPDFSSGWTPGPTMVPFGGALLCDVIPKPQLIGAPDFSSGWTLGPTMSAAGGQLLLDIIPRPQFIFGTSGDFTSSPYVTYSAGDARSLSGSSDVRVVGPIDQEQFLPNQTFDTDLSGWVQLSGTWTHDATRGLGGSGAASTSGPGSPDAKVLVADFNPGVPGTDALHAQTGDEFVFRGSFGCQDGPNTNGSWYMVIHQKQATVSDLEEWVRSPLVSAFHMNDGEWSTAEVRVTIPAHLPYLDALIVGDFHTVGTVLVDNVSLRRTRGNNTGIYTDAFPAVVGQAYRASVMVNSTLRVAGSVTVRLIFEGPGKPVIEERSSQQTYTFEQWVFLKAEGVCPKGYTTVKMAIDGDDIQGGVFVADVDTTSLEQADNNTDRATYTPVTVVPRQAYTLGVTTQSLAAIKAGSVTAGVVLSGPGLDDDTRSVEFTFSDDDGTPQRKFLDVNPGDGYVTATGFVVSKDLDGAAQTLVAVSNFTLEQADNNSDRTMGTAVDLIPDQRYLLGASADYGLANTKGTVTAGITLSGPGLDDEVVSVDVTRPTADTSGTPNRKTAEVKPPPGYTSGVPFVQSTDVEGGPIAVRNFTLTKMDNNTDTIVGTPFPVTGERTYHWPRSVWSGVNLQRGSVKCSVRFTAPDRVDVVMDSSLVEGTKGVWKADDFAFTAPSGYRMGEPSVTGIDIDGDVFRLDGCSITDGDRTTRVFDDVTDATGELVIGATAPEGTEKVGVALVAESGAYSWQAGSVVLHRPATAPTAASIVDALLHDPLSGEYLLLPGNIIGADPLLHDWLIEYMSLRAALVHLSTAGLVSPRREDRVNPETMTYDWGTPGQLYREREALVLTNAQPVVVDGVAVDENTEAQVERVVVIGATKADAKGRPVQIIGVAANDPTGEDWRDNPVVRTLTITDSAAETVEYANALARYHLDVAAVSVVNVTATLANWEAISTFDVGDWVFPENRDAGLEGDVDGVELGGETIWPQRERVVARTTKMGQEEFRAEVLADGEWVPLTGVVWETATTAAVELGTVLPDFVADPQNGSAITQFNEFALSHGR